MQPRLQEKGKGPCRQAELRNDQKIDGRIRLRPVKKEHHKVQRRREIVTEQPDRVAAQPFRERIFNAVLSVQQILVVVKKIKILYFAVCRCQRTVAEGLDPELCHQKEHHKKCDPHSAEANDQTLRYLRFRELHFAAPLWS